MDLLGFREKPVHSKGDQSWMFFGRTDAKAETPVLWPPHAKSWLIGKHSDAGRDWGQEEKGTTKDEIAGWHHRLDGHEFGWTQGVGARQGGLACCNSWGRKESDTTEWLNWTDGKQVELFILNELYSIYRASDNKLKNQKLYVYTSLMFVLTFIHSSNHYWESTMCQALGIQRYTR